MTTSVKILVMMAFIGIGWVHGFLVGKRFVEAAYTQQAIEVAKQVESASLRASQALSDISKTISGDDLSLSAVEDNLINEKTDPDSCSVGAGRLLGLDRIR